MGHFLLFEKVSSLSHPHFLARDPVGFHRESAPRDAMLHQRALETKSFMAIVGSCLTASSAVWPLMEECPPPHLHPPQCSSREGFPYHNHSLDSRTPQAGGDRDRGGMYGQCESTSFLINIWTHGEEGSANFKLFSERQHAGPTLSLPSLLTPARTTLCQEQTTPIRLDRPTVAAACEWVPGASIP